MKVAVVGGGVVGLSTALELRLAGADVLLLERAACGQAASAGNAGWVTPAFSAPLAAPGSVSRALRWMLNPNSPFLVRPRLDPSFLRWSWRFARSTRRERYRAGMQALVRLSERAFEDFARLRAHGVAFEMHAPGLLFLALNPSALDEYARTLEELVGLGYRASVERLDGDSARAREPAVGAQVTAAIFASREAYVRPETLCAGLLQALHDARVQVVEEAPVVSLRRAQTGWLLTTPTQEHEAEKIVLAAGAWTAQLVRQVGKRIPLEGAKGYSLTTAAAGPAASHTLYFSDAKIAYTPFNGKVRLAGTLELAGLDPRLRRGRLEMLQTAAASYLKDWRPTGQPEEWAGFRPLAPDGLPLIGEVPSLPGLFLATGHGMLGITLAPTTAALLAPVVLGASDGHDLASFSPARF